MTTTRSHFAFRIDVWTANGESIVDHLAGVEDYELPLVHFPPRLRALARYAHHPAAGRARDRGQPAPPSGVV